MASRDLILASQNANFEHPSLSIDGVINVYDAVRVVMKVNGTGLPWPIRRSLLILCLTGVCMYVSMSNGMIAR